MDPFPMEDLFDFMGPIFLLSLLLPLIVTGVIIGVVIWAIRRNTPRREEPAVEELKARLAAERSIRSNTRSGSGPCATATTERRVPPRQGATRGPRRRSATIEPPIHNL